MSKQIKENSNASGAVAGAGAGHKINNKNSAPFTEVAVSPAGYGVVFKKKKNKNGKKNFKVVASETKAESTLREAIRDLIFLNRIKYHEEQAKKGLEEQKLRKVIRFLLNEADDAQESGLSSTGQTSGYAFLKKIEKTTFQNDFQALKSTKEQREEFKRVYLTGIKIYLDALDQQYLILNPDQRTPSSNSTPDLGGVPAKRSLREQDELNPNNIARAAKPVADQSSIKTDMMQDKAVSSALTATSPEGDVTGRAAAKEALKRDLPQIDPLYFNLTFKTIDIKGVKTNDRKEFRMFLIGDGQRVGNIQLKFKEWDERAPIGGTSAEDVPQTEVPAIEPDLTTGGTMAAAGSPVMPNSGPGAAIPTTGPAGTISPVPAPEEPALPPGL